MRQKLNSRTVSSLTAKSTPYEVRDTDIRGFLIRVQRSGEKTYYLDYRNAHGQRNRLRLGSASTLTPLQARDLAKKRAGDVAHGIDLQAAKKTAKRAAEIAKKRTLGVFLEQVYAPWFSAHLSKTTDNVRKVRIAFPDLLGKSMSDLNPWTLEKWRIQQKQRGREATTINRQIAALKSVITKAIEWGYLDFDPLPRQKFKQLKTDDLGRLRYLTSEEEQRLRAALDARELTARQERGSANAWRLERGYASLPDLWQAPFVDHLKPLVLVALNTGMRRGELFKLRWDQVDLRNRLLTITGKTAKSKKTRHIPLNDEVHDILRRWQSAAATQGLVFPATDGGELNNVQTSWEKIVRDAEIKDFRFHDLRHTFASKLVMAGVDLNTVRELLGHADIKMTLRYAHLSEAHKAAAVARLCDTDRYQGLPQ